MPLMFKYKAAARSGTVQKGLVEAEDIESAKITLDSKGLIPISVKPAVEFKKFFRKFYKTSLDLELLSSFTQKLNTLNKAGIPILKALSIIASEQENDKFEKTLIRMKQYIEGGMTLSQALEQFPEYFPPLFISTVSAGESSGQMEAIFDRLSELIEREIKTRETLKSAVRYPAYIMITIVLAIIALVTLVIPKFAEFYKFYKSDLPLPTRLIMDLSSFTTSYWYIVLISGILSVFLFYRFKETKIGSNFLDYLKIELPIVGKIFLQMTISRFCYLLGTLLRSGLPIVEALGIVSRAAGNSLISKVINQMSDNVKGGRDIFSPMRESKYFAPLVIQMFVIGMESGNLDNMLFEAARHYDAAVEYQSKKLTSRLEPILTLFVGGMVLALALAIFLPMWNMMQVFKK